MAPRQQRGPGRGALRLGRVIGQPETLPCEPVNTLGPCAPERSAAVTAQFTETEIVDVKEQHIGSPAHISLQSRYVLDPPLTGHNASRFSARRGSVILTVTSPQCPAASRRASFVASD